MKQMDSKITSMEGKFAACQQQLEGHNFSLGGNWDYNHGSFDRALDDEHKVWLRLPFSVIAGELDSESANQETIIKFDQPYVLKHLYNEGLDPSADATRLAGLINQFQDPVDADAPIEEKWMKEATRLLREIESFF